MTLLSERAVFLSTAPPRTPPANVHYPLPHRFNRLLTNSILPVRTQNRLRDNGSLRTFVDGLVTLSAPVLALKNSKAAAQFIYLSRRLHSIKYGEHNHQRIEMFFPNDTNEVRKGLVYFVHGGAWGSGSPWMYRLISVPFLEMGLAVAIIGYRTFPDGNVEDQVQDLWNAALILEKTFPLAPIRNDDANWIGKILIGHSSGAHIALLLIIRQLQSLLQKENTTLTEHIHFDLFLGLSGVYSVPHHFEYETWRGVEEISPMKPACGHHKESFEHNSPITSLLKSISSWSVPVQDLDLSSRLPRILLIHGIEDSTVPFTSSADAAYMIRSMGIDHCYEYYIPGVEHQDTIMDLMLGGITREICKRFISSRATDSSSVDGQQVIKSRL